jgi:hypothetical protein
MQCEKSMHVNNPHVQSFRLVVIHTAAKYSSPAFILSQFAYSHITHHAPIITMHILTKKKHTTIKPIVIESD